MTKIRIYELARELGLDNKGVLGLCDKLGIEGKSSHSHSLSDDEADKIRRSVIRRAFNSKATTVRESKVDGTVVTERRMGNVIRRKRKPLEHEVEMPEVEEDFTSEAATTGFDDSLGETYDAVEHEESGDSSEQDLEADVSSHQQECDSSGEDGGEAESFVESSVDGSEVGVGEDTEEGYERSGEDLLNASEQDTPVGETEDSSQDKPELSGSGIDLDEVRRRHDIRAPKVLGRIDLPVAPVVIKSQGGAAGGDSKDGGKEEARGEHRSRKGVKSSAVKPEQEADAAKAGRSKGKKGPAYSAMDDEFAKRKRKKQVLRKDDLLDYGSEREGWKTKKDKKLKKGQPDANIGITAPARASKRVIKIAEDITVGELARQLGLKASEVIKKLMGLGVMANINQILDFDTATLVAEEYQFTTTLTGQEENNLLAELKASDKEEDLITRPPIVTVMGHVDHGKTSLLDAIRKTSVTTQEAGGITQHIGAYNVTTPSGASVTFIDTPGHEAFTAMRGRGAKVTDIVVLVVAADDGVMPQTMEAISHAKAAGVPIVVAINKIDKEDANPDRVKNQLAEQGLIPEDWGGDTIMVHVSAVTGDGLELLLENLHLQSELLELKANPDRKAIGTVIEAKLDKARGTVITVLVRNGTLRTGDSFIVGQVVGRVRVLNGSLGEVIEEAGPSMPAEILGASSAPAAGDEFLVVDDMQAAREIALQRQTKIRTRELLSRGGGSVPLTLENFSDFIGAGELKELPLIIKADVDGSAEAVSDALGNLSNAECKVKILHKAVGAVTENDVQLAIASNAVIIAFNVRSDTRAAALAEQENVDIRYSRIIYELVESIEAALKGMLAPELREKTLGRAQVRETFKVPRIGLVAGSYVTDGSVVRGSLVRLLRDNKVVFEGKMASLRRFKDDVKEVQTGYECGIGIEGYNDIKQGDVIEVFKVEEHRPV